MNKDTQVYNDAQQMKEEICNVLAQEINKGLPKAENKYGVHPVWF